MFQYKWCFYSSSKKFVYFIRLFTISGFNPCDKNNFNLFSIVAENKTVFLILCKAKVVLCRVNVYRDYASCDNFFFFSLIAL